MMLNPLIENTKDLNENIKAENKENKENKKDSNAIADDYICCMFFNCDCCFFLFS